MGGGRPWHMPGHKGPFINDAMQEGGGGMWFCDGEYEDVIITMCWSRQYDFNLEKMI